MKIKSKVLGTLVIVVIFGSIFISSALDLWKTESSKIPKRITEGKFVGKYDPNDIRGAYTFGEVSEIFDIPLEDLRKAFGLSKDIDVSKFKNRDLEEIYGELEEQGKEIGNASVKFFVALYIGVPYDFDEDTYLSKEAVEILKKHDVLLEEHIKYLDIHTVDISSFMSKEINQEEAQEIHEKTERTIKGKTTFKEVLDWGVSKEVIEEILGISMPNSVLGIREYCLENDIQYSEVREKFQNEIDMIKE